MGELARLVIQFVGVLYGPLDRTLGWLQKRPLELVAGLCLLVVGALGALLIVAYYGRRDSLTGWLLGGLLLVASLGGIYLLSPLGVARFSGEFVRTWFRAMAGVAAAVALTSVQQLPCPMPRFLTRTWRWWRWQPCSPS